MKDKCDYDQEGFCTAQIEYPDFTCPSAKKTESGLLICEAKPNDLIERWEECEWCGGPNSEDCPCSYAIPEIECWKVHECSETRQDCISKEIK